MAYLVVWGTSTEAIRSSSARTEEDAAYECFGSYDGKKMTFAKVPVSVLRSTKKRIYAIRELLAEHKKHVPEPEVEKAVSKELDSLKAMWG